MAEIQEQKKMLRAALYIDGFNLYHPIHENGENFLKWNCLQTLGKNMASKAGFQLVKVVFCTAFPKHMGQGTKDRYLAYRNALRARGVHVIEGHYIEERSTGKWSEKQSDINVSLSCLFDAVDDVYDVAYLLSADSDQAATARVFKERFKGKRLIPVAPPNKKVPTKVADYSGKGFVLKISDLEKCVMSNAVQGKKGLIRRPVAYNPPAGWVHPINRP